MAIALSASGALQGLRRQVENVNYYRYYMMNKLFPKMIQLPGNELSGVHHVVYNEAVEERNLFDVSHVYGTLSGVSLK